MAASLAAAGTQSPAKAPALKGAAATARQPPAAAAPPPPAPWPPAISIARRRWPPAISGSIRAVPRARVVVARVHLARGELDAAWRELNRAAAEHPRDVDVLYYLGQVSGQLAAEQFERLVQQSPMSARGHQLLAESFEAQERRSDAEREYQAALAAKPDLLEALLGLARLQRIRLDCDGAKALYARAEAVRPTFDAAYGIGACLLREQEHDAARAQFERAVARDPQSAIALVGLGSALLGLNRAAEAITPLERAVAIEPAMDDGWYVLGRAYQAAGRRRPGAARVCHRRAAADGAAAMTARPRRCRWPCGGGRGRSLRRCRATTGRARADDRGPARARRRRRRRPLRRSHGGVRAVGVPASRPARPRSATSSRRPAPASPCGTSMATDASTSTW